MVRGLPPSHTLQHFFCLHAHSPLLVSIALLAFELSCRKKNQTQPSLFPLYKITRFDAIASDSDADLTSIMI